MTEPFWEVPRERVESRDRLLLITYHFPPACSAGALRWQKLAAHAYRRGWELDVATLAPEGAQHPDPATLADLPAGTRVYGIPRRHLPFDRVVDAAWNRLRGFRARNRKAPSHDAAASMGAKGRPGSLGRGELSLATPDDLHRAFHAWRSVAADGAWGRDACALASRVIDPRRHRAVITCGPPHMAHLAGSTLARKYGLPHVVDMRDPWSLVERIPASIASPVGLALARRYERRVIRSAALVVANTDPAAAALRRQYPAAAGKIIAVMNGYDDDPLPVVARPARFVVAYAGTVYLDRDPRPLFRAAARVRDEFGPDASEFGIEFMGQDDRFEGRTVPDLATDVGAGGLVTLHPPSPRSEAERFLAGAAMLVSLPQDSEMAIPSKVFEYLRFPAWVLALAEKGSATEVALRGTRADVVSSTDDDGIHRVLRQRFLEYRNGVRPAPEPALGRLSRAAQAEILFAAIEERLGGPVPGGAGDRGEAPVALRAAVSSLP